ncbi:hypothetical protein JOC34_000578 [Virgibacillus halotolerans]|uniref:hypothetical protein n=1 Tax=Virgibacillus halotolerans TaxID=1071053 RepID=UPI00195F6161|nr:hypothetical protein [Virgibacillus halotolerans]MBM7598221.1 hypothetical protein [Virgibacillus halotolerans]
MDKMGDKVKSDKHLLVLYYKFVDKIDIDKDNMSTKQFLSDATSPIDIINAKYMYEIKDY